MSDKTHAKLSPSASKRWFNCPGSIRIQEALGRASTTNESAERGTAAHSLAEECMREGIDASERLGSTITTEAGWNFTVDDTMASGVQQYLDYCRHISEPDVLELETHLDLSALVQGVSGTADCYIVKGPHLYVIDYKNGRSPVDVAFNSQLMIYALGALMAVTPKHDIKIVHCVIVQPNAASFDGAVKSFTQTADELRSWGINVLRPSAEAARRPDAPARAGDWCLWCEAEGVCTATCDSNARAMRTAFGKDPVRPETLSPMDLAIALQWTSRVTRWVQAVRNCAEGVLLNGGTIIGQKLVTATTQRKWGDVAAATEELSRVLGEDGFKRSILKPAGALKALKAKGFTKEQLEAFESKFVVKPEGALVMVPDGEARQEQHAETNEDRAQLDFA